jgi:hypothetical protein
MYGTVSISGFVLHAFMVALYTAALAPILARIFISIKPALGLRKKYL